jgi:small subunit ribosomal protein S9
VTPEERDDTPQEPEAGTPPEGDEQPQDAEAVPGEPGEAAPEQPEVERAEQAAGKGDDASDAEQPEEAPAAEGGGEEPPGTRRRGKGDKKGSEEELIPGAHLEPDLVLDEQRSEEGEYGEYGEYADEGVPEQEPVEEEAGAETQRAEPEPVSHKPLDLAADARYAATGKRKSAVARVILRPGEGTYTINSRHLDEYFPRVRLQRMARQPLEAAGYQNRMDVVARIHGGGVSAQATALRHGVARALVEADPALRGELKRRGYLTRDPRVKERKKAGLKKARKRPQFSKR